MQAQLGVHIGRRIEVKEPTCRDCQNPANSPTEGLCWPHHYAYNQKLVTAIEIIESFAPKGESRHEI